jgi:hypothetical protein
MSATIEIHSQASQLIESRRRNIDAHELAMGVADARETPGGLFAPGFQMENRVTAAADDVYHGGRGWREWLEDLHAAFAEDACYAVEEIIEASDELVVARFSIRGHGAHSGNWIDFTWTGVTWFRDGLALRAVGYSTREEAMIAAEATGQTLRVRPTYATCPR